jgi:branched-chain amino acid transport system substrate-binding protein
MWVSRGGKALFVAGAAIASLAAAGTVSGERTGVTATQRAAAVGCAKTAQIGYFGPTTGAAASIGQELRNWTLFQISQWNARKTTRPKISVVEGDTQLDPAQASTIAQQFASNPNILGVAGPAGSQEVLAAAPAFQAGGMPFVSGPATRIDLTIGPNRVHGFFRIAPNDSLQASSTAEFMLKTLNVKRVFVVDDQSSYSVPLAQDVSELLKRAGVSVTRQSTTQQQADFSSIVSGIPSNTNLVYLPIQLPAQMELFSKQMLEQGKRIPLFVGNAGFSQAFTSEGAYISTFAPDIRAIRAAKSTVSAYFKRYGSSAPLTTFGPTAYLSAQVLAGAISRACKDGKATRAEVTAQLFKTRAAHSIIGEPIRFNANGDRVGARFRIFQIKNGQRVLMP